MFRMKLEAIAHDIGKFGLVSACVIVLVLLIRFTIERIDDNSFRGRHVGEMLGFLIIGITVVVVAIPEGLPLAVTLSLAYSTKRMLKDNNLVRKMAACETMGGASMICSDKTGTLT
jgi:P-type E1-E2 ATPase